MAQARALAVTLPVATDVDRQAPDALDGCQQVLARLLGDDLAEQRAQQLDLPRERVAGARRADAGRAPRAGFEQAVSVDGCRLAASDARRAGVIESARIRAVAP